jgi:hypothetical protein
MFKVIEAASEDQQLITTVAAVKTELDISDSSQDAFLLGRIKQISGQVVSFLRVPQASDGSATLASETLEQTFRFGRRDQGCRTKLILARRPVTSIETVEEDGRALTTDDYELDGAPGLLRRIRNDCESTWGRHIVVTFKAGWIMPSEASGVTLPMDIQGAVAAITRQAFLTKDRDYTIKSEWILDVERRDFGNAASSSTANDSNGAGSDSPFPPDITNTLLRYRYRNIGAV